MNRLIDQIVGMLCQRLLILTGRRTLGKSIQRSRFNLQRIDLKLATGGINGAKCGVDISALDRKLPATSEQHKTIGVMVPERPSLGEHLARQLRLSLGRFGGGEVVAVD